MCYNNKNVKILSCFRVNKEKAALGIETKGGFFP